ncbi:MAG: hypothetical protein HYS17_08665 [Micavibrio aeruginosavorus]|uniref:PQ loop repeat family protein n=1 Tax=Micavibrio aeruginosavorus TaxID=349221 RepID=A0A7T5R1A0_9BACT|nr:MAG: hypothetical protein HYS17_08665 [Micavibrio aeruginosavorus]
MPLNEWLSYAGMFLAIYCLVPYYRGILARKTQPHVFSWLIFGVITGIAAAVQFAEGGGAGAWVVALNAGLCFTVVLLALCFGKRDIRPVDWMALVAAFMSIPVWLLADNPALAVMILLAIEVFAYIPTIRKSWNKPHEEVVQTWLLGSLTFFLAVISLERYEFATVAYPAFVSAVNLGLALMLLIRRRVMGGAAAQP